MKTLLPAVIVAAVALPIPRAVAGQTIDAYTFHVPVQMDNVMPEVDHFRVFCSVHVGGAALLNTRLYSGSSDAVQIPDGSYSGTVTVTIRELVANVQQYAIDFWQCRLALYDEGVAAADAGSDSQYGWAQPRPGTPFVGSVEGPIP